MNPLDGFWNKCRPSLVPDISDELLAEMQAQIKPVVFTKGEGFHLVKDEDIHPRRTAYTWVIDENLGREVNLAFGDLNSVEIITFHKYGAPVFFKPSIAEVMASINRFIPDWKDKVRFFMLEADELGAENVIGDCHFCKCRLFGDEHMDDHPLVELARAVDDET